MPPISFTLVSSWDEVCSSCLSRQHPLRYISHYWNCLLFHLFMYFICIRAMSHNSLWDNSKLLLGENTGVELNHLGSIKSLVAMAAGHIQATAEGKAILILMATTTKKSVTHCRKKCDLRYSGGIHINHTESFEHSCWIVAYQWFTQSLK